MLPSLLQAYFSNRRHLRLIERFLARATAALEGALDAGLDGGSHSHFSTIKWLIEDEDLTEQLERLSLLTADHPQVAALVRVVADDVWALEADRRLFRSRAHADDLWRDMRELLHALYHWKDEAEDAVFDKYPQ